MKKNKLIGASLALALATGVITPQAFAATELEQDLINAYEMQEVLDKDTEEVNKIRRGKSEEKPDDNKKPSTPSDDDKDHDDDLTGGALEDKGYDSKEEAEKAGKKALENSPNKKSYTVSKGVDGKYYFHLWEDGENTTNNTKDNKNNNKNEGSTKESTVDTSKNKENKENNKQVANGSSNVKTGITPLTGVVATLIASVGAFSYSKKENK